MKNKLFKIIGVILLIIISFFILYKILNNKQPIMKEIIFTDKNEVVNNTRTSGLDTIVHVGLQKLNIDNISVFISLLTAKSNMNIDDDIDIVAYTTKFGDNLYSIYIKEDSQINSIEVIAHELIHLKQYYTGRLIVEDNNILWLGKKVDVKSYSNYISRPWEDEAYHQQKDLYNEIKKVIY